VTLDTLEDLHVIGTRAFLAFTNIKLYVVALLEVGSVGVVRVHEKVATALLLNETIALFRAEPFDFTLWHRHSPVFVSLVNVAFRSLVFLIEPAEEIKRLPIRLVECHTQKDLNIKE